MFGRQILERSDLNYASTAQYKNASHKMQYQRTTYLFQLVGDVPSVLFHHECTNQSEP
jgi:hypothetical protein